MKAKKPKRRGLADMSFDEGLARLIQTRPEEVTLAKGQNRKVAKATKRLATLAKPHAKPHKEAG